MYLNKLIFVTVLLSTSTFSFVIPNNNNNDFISLPLIKRSSTIIKRSTSETYKLYNADKVEYLTKIYIGTPPQEFLVSIDTGSADTWVPSMKCPKSQCPYQQFDTKKSSTFQTMNMSFAVTYGQGSIHGNYGKDTINLLGPESGLSCIEQPFGLTNSARDIISTDMKMTSNGILGLAFPALTANSDTMEAYNPFVFELAAKKLIKEGIFSISLNDKNGWQSELTIGGINNNNDDKEIKYVPVEKNINPKTNELDYTFWSIKLSQVNINNSSIKVKDKVILDTGTTYSYLTKGLADQIVQYVTQQQKLSFDLQSQLYIVDCKLRSSNQTIELEFDQRTKLLIHVTDLILPPNNNNECQFTITFNYNENDNMILGDNILRSTLFVFDMNLKRVGIAIN